MLKVEICVGSSCHLKGSHQVVTAFQQGIEELALKDKSEVELVGSFCQGKCTEGVVVKINDQTYTEVTPEKVADILKTFR